VLRGEAMLDTQSSVEIGEYLAVVGEKLVNLELTMHVEPGFF